MRPDLNDPDLFREQALVAGAWCDGPDGARMNVDNPSTGAVIGTIPACSPAQAIAAIEAASAAQGSWRHVAAAERARILGAWHDLMIAHADDLARIMTAEQGKPLAEARGEVLYAASFIKWYAAEAERITGEMLMPSPDRRIAVLREPVGVVAAITPWNFPLAMITRKCAPALAAGCAMVVKPSELTPYSALALGVLAERAGLPAGVLSILTGEARDIGPELTGHTLVRKISFTGSTATGALLMRQSADTIKKLSLELGGNAPLIVFDDADFDVAIAGTMAAKFRNAGQTCVCANRVYVQDGIYDAFLARLEAEVAALVTGDGMTPGVQIGPLINDAAVAKVWAHVQDARAKGARILGREWTVRGRFVAPLVLANVTDDMLIAREETFGPVLPVFRIKTEAQAVTSANTTPFGLAAYVFTRDLDRAWRVADALEFGMVGLNTGAISTAVAPFGGIKQSGLGREGGRHGIEEFLEMKTVHLALSAQS